MPAELFCRKRKPFSPTWTQDGAQDDPRRIQRHQDAPKTAFETVLGRCWSALGAQAWPDFGYKSAQEAQRGPKSPQKTQDARRGPKKPQEVPRSPRKPQEAPRGPKRPQKAPRGPKRATPRSQRGEPGTLGGRWDHQDFPNLEHRKTQHQHSNENNLKVSTTSLTLNCHATWRPSRKTSGKL